MGKDTVIKNGDDLLRAFGIPIPPKLVASELTDEEIAQLRFTTVSDEESDEIAAELEKRKKLKEQK